MAKVGVNGLKSGTNETSQTSGVAANQFLIERQGQNILVCTFSSVEGQMTGTKEWYREAGIMIHWRWPGLCVYMALNG